MSGESHEQLASIKENSDMKRHHVIRSGMTDNIVKKEEDSDAGISMCLLTRKFSYNNCYAYQTSVHQLQAIQRMMLRRTRLL